MIEKYDKSRYRVERYSNDTKTWIEIPAAQIDYSFDYQPNEAGVLIVGIETISLTVEFQGAPTSTPLFPTERVRERYLHNGTTWQDWSPPGGYTCERTNMERIADHSGDVGLGYLYRYRFTASLVGYYAAMMDFEICKVVVDGELAYDTLKKYGVTVVS